MICSDVKNRSSHQEEKVMSSAFVEKYLENYEKSEKKGLMCIPSGNHDMGRLSQEVKGDELKVAFAVPFINARSTVYLLW